MADRFTSTFFDGTCQSTVSKPRIVKSSTWRNVGVIMALCDAITPRA
jgi:hypothetical protein